MISGSMSHPTLREITLRIQSQNIQDRLLALSDLRNMPTVEAFPLIRQVLNDESITVRSLAIRSLVSHPTVETLPLLVRLLEDQNYEIRAGAAGALGVLGDPQALKPLIRAFLEDTEWLVCYSAAVSLGNLQDPRAHDVLVHALHRPEVMIQQAAIAALGEIGALDALDALLGFAQSKDWLIRQSLAATLGKLPHPKSLAALNYLAKDDHPQVSTTATSALNRVHES